MKKSKISVTLSLLLLAGVLCSCGGQAESKSTEETSTSSQSPWKSEWSYDEDYHWHENEDPSVKFVKDKAPHVWNEGEETVAPTEHSTGLKVYTCEICGATKEEVIDKLEHTHVISETYSHDEHNHWKTCEGCDEIFELAPHEGGSATCEHQAICDVCGEPYGELGTHRFGSLVPKVEPNCEEDGHEAYYQCLDCQKYFTEDQIETTYEALIIPISTHFGDLVEKVEPTCEEDGHEAYYHCEECDKYLDENKNPVSWEDLVIPAKGHSYGELVEGIEATCDTDGRLPYYHCNVCDKYFKEDKTEVTFEELTIPAGHDLSLHYHDFASYWDGCSRCGELTRKTPLSWEEGTEASYSRVDTNNLDETRTVSIYDGTSVSSSLSGDGSSSSPYLIQSAADFVYLAGLVSGGNNLSGKTVKMMVSVDLKSHPLAIGGYASEVSFAGTFDGNGQYVLNMALTKDQAGNGDNYLGLFPTTGATSLIKDLAVTGTVTGAGSVGGIAGFINGKIEHCYNFATISATAGNVGGIVAGTYSNNASVKDCVNFGEVISTAATSNAGGIYGSVRGQVVACENYGEVNAPGTAGGVAGVGYGAFQECINYGKVNTPNGYSAGILGVSNGTGASFEDCINKGEVHTKLYSGGILGTTNHKNGDQLIDCSNEGKIVAGGSCIGGIIGAPIGFGLDYTATLTRCANKGTVKGGNRVGSLVGWFPGASYDECENQGVVIDNGAYWENLDLNHELADKKELTWTEGAVEGNARTDTNSFGFSRTVSIWDGSSVSSSLAGAGTSGSPYLIQSAADLAYFANTVASGNNNFSGKQIRMDVSVDLNHNPLMIGGWEAEKSFAGTFDGYGQHVLNMNITDSLGMNAYGLFCTTAASSIVKNVSTYGLVSGNAYSGGVVGFPNGAVENCYNFASVTSSKGNIGGIAGGTYNTSAKINYCANFGDISCPAGVSSSSGTGGIMGFFRGTINDSSNYGPVTSLAPNLGGIAGIGYGTIQNSANRGFVDSAGHAGGILGVCGTGRSDGVDKVILTGCTNLGDLAGRSYSGGIVGTINNKNADNVFTRCVNHGAIRAVNQSGIGGIVGSTLVANNTEYHVTFVDCMNTGLIVGSSRIGGIAGQCNGTYSGCVNYGTIQATGTPYGELFGSGEMVEA